MLHRIQCLIFALLGFVCTGAISCNGSDGTTNLEIDGDTEGDTPEDADVSRDADLGNDAEPDSDPDFEVVDQCSSPYFCTSAEECLLTVGGRLVDAECEKEPFCCDPTPACALPNQCMHRSACSALSGDEVAGFCEGENICCNASPPCEAPNTCVGEADCLEGEGQRPVAGGCTEAGQVCCNREPDCIAPDGCADPELCETMGGSVVDGYCSDATSSCCRAAPTPCADRFSCSTVCQEELVVEGHCDRGVCCDTRPPCPGVCPNMFCFGRIDNRYRCETGRACCMPIVECPEYATCTTGECHAFRIIPDADCDSELERCCDTRPDCDSPSLGGTCSLDPSCHDGGMFFHEPNDDGFCPPGQTCCTPWSPFP